MFNQKDCRVTCQAADQIVKAFNLALCETLRGFIQDQQPRLLCNAHRDFQKTLMTIRQIACDLQSAVCQTHPVKRSKHLRLFPLAQGQRDVVKKA